MIYLSGTNFNGASEIFVGREDVGCLVQPRSYPYPDKRAKCWAGDNGAFTGTFRHDRFLNWLSGLTNLSDTCLFVAVPDVLGNWQGTLQKFQMYESILRKYGFPLALVGQDGFCADEVKWDKIDAFFVGGSNDWKFSQGAAKAISRAKDMGKWVHMGRVNSYKRLRLAQVLGCDSADGNHVKFKPDVNAKHIIKWLDSVNKQSHFSWKL
jgi:hypothetical protein